MAGVRGRLLKNWPLDQKVATTLMASTKDANPMRALRQHRALRIQVQRNNASFEKACERGCPIPFAPFGSTPPWPCAPPSNELGRRHRPGESTADNPISPPRFATGSVLSRPGTSARVSFGSIAPRSVGNELRRPCIMSSPAKKGHAAHK